MRQMYAHMHMYMISLFKLNTSFSIRCRVILTFNRAMLSFHLICNTWFYLHFIYQENERMKGRWMGARREMTNKKCFRCLFAVVMYLFCRVTLHVYISALCFAYANVYCTFVVCMCVCLFRVKFSLANANNQKLLQAVNVLKLKFTTIDKTLNIHHHLLLSHKNSQLKMNMEYLFILCVFFDSLFLFSMEISSK